MLDSAVVFDTEVYRNYFLAAFEKVSTGQRMLFEAGDGLPPMDRDLLLKVCRRNLIVGFNSRNYDLLMIWLAISGAAPAAIKRASDMIIVGGERPWDVERQFEVRVPQNLNHVDLIEVAPGQASLKLYGGRLHAPKMQDLPIEPDATLTPEQMKVIRHYNANDLAMTKLLFESLRPQIELRAEMGVLYGQDLRSKSDAQIAEAVIKSQVAKRTGMEIERPLIAAGTEFRYRPPAYIAFRSAPLRALLDKVSGLPMTISQTGSVLMPPALEQAQIELGGQVYRMGIGGLHSSEQVAAHFADEDHVLVDRDVASYYPAIILTLGLAPRQIGADFLAVYRSIVDRRLAAKRAGDKVTADSLKIVVNGSFGKFGSKWSALYAPDLMIQVTLTGQLALLMLIERLVDAGCPVVSGNTDGVVIRCPKLMKGAMGAVVAAWERDTGFETEETHYRALYSRDVNNYLAIKPNGSVKAKGAFAGAGLNKNPTNQICLTAVADYLTKGVPIAETIYGCNDIREFVTVRTVQGGALWNDEYLGKAVRWYYARGGQPIFYKKFNDTGGHNKVPRTDGARPIMDLPETFPEDLDYHWYVEETRSILRDVGALEPLPPPAKVRRVTKTSARAWLLAGLVD